MKKSIQLFQFKYYSEQQKLLLSKEELEQVKNGVIRPPSSNSYESRLIASKILIKVLPFFILCFFFLSPLPSFLLPLPLTTSPLSPCLFLSFALALPLFFSLSLSPFLSILSLNLFVSLPLFLSVLWFGLVYCSLLNKFVISRYWWIGSLMIKKKVPLNI